MRRFAASIPVAPAFAFLAVLLMAPSDSTAQGSAVPSAPANAPYRNSSLPVEERVADLLSRMTLEEKATMLSGSGWMESAPIETAGDSGDQDGRRADGRAVVGG